MKQGDENGEAHGSLSRGNRHHEKDKDQPVELMELPRVGEEGEIHGVDHQLDCHEDRDAVLSSQHAADADGEEHRAEDQKPLGRDHDACAPRPLSTSAPTIDASRSIETISNGKM